MTGVIVAVLLLAVAVVIAPLLAVNAVLQHFTPRQPGELLPLLKPLVESLEELVRAKADQIIGAAYQLPQQPPAAPAVPDAVLKWAMQESEPWAADDQLARAKELYAELDDGQRSADELWAHVMSICGLEVMPERS